VVTSLAPRKSVGFESLVLHQKGFNMDFQEKYRRENVCTAIPRWWPKEAKKIDFATILEKIEKVIISCKTEDQLEVARNFMLLGFELDKNLGEQLDHYDMIKFQNKLDNLLLAKYEELEWT